MTMTIKEFPLASLYKSFQVYHEDHNFMQNSKLGYHDKICTRNQGITTWFVSVNMIVLKIKNNNYHLVVVIFFERLVLNFTLSDGLQI